MATFFDTHFSLLVTLVKIPVVLVVLLTVVAYAVWLERKFHHQLDYNHCWFYRRYYISYI